METVFDALYACVVVIGISLLIGLGIDVVAFILLGALRLAEEVWGL